MKVISYAEEHIVTTDEIADEVLKYARDLGRTKTADTIDIPALYQDGHVGQVHLLIGPSSQITVLESDQDSADIDGQQFIAELQRRSAAMRSQRAAVVGDEQYEAYDPDEPSDAA
ncbi:hypothetical protein [Naasia sp. SYSU D00948]|uniref:hypothetical protein n=1 Tax=Naasia sp. SYSU D00948 TaxID=2817379 RepID=UPI001B31691D|nr:hypothetical protein [Naasia sp. SYSU D00948]